MITKIYLSVFFFEASHRCLNEMLVFVSVTYKIDKILINILLKPIISLQQHHTSLLVVCNDCRRQLQICLLNFLRNFLKWFLKVNDLKKQYSDVFSHSPVKSLRLYTTVQSTLSCLSFLCLFKRVFFKAVLYVLRVSDYIKNFSSLISSCYGRSRHWRWRFLSTI